MFVVLRDGIFTLHFSSYELRREEVGKVENNETLA